MSRFSPTVQPTWGETFSHALGQVVPSFTNARRQRNEDERQKDEDAISLYHQGLREQTPADQAAVPNAAAVNTHLAAALNPSVGIPAPAVQPEYAGPDFANALQGAVKIGTRSFVPTDQAKRQQQQALEDRAFMLQDRGVGQDLKRSEIFKNTAQGTKDLQPAAPRAPLPGTPEWRQMEIDKAKIAAQYGYHAPSPEVGGKEKFDADQRNKILDDYARDTKDFHQVMSGWGVLQGAVKDPSLATPFAVTDAYARITNPGALVRPTTLEMINQMGSVGQRMQKFWTHNAEGQLPPDIMRDFQKTLYNIVAEHKKQYDQIRGQAVARGKAAGADVSPFLQDYELTDPTAPVVPGGRAALPSRGGAAQSPTPQQSLWDAAVAKHGRAKVLQEYGDRP